MYELKEKYFDGTLYSLREICNTIGIEIFCINYGYLLNRVQKLYSCSLPTPLNVEDLLDTDNFQERFEFLVDSFKQKDRRLEKQMVNREILISQLRAARRSYCGIGTKKTKILLNKLGKDFALARVARLVLEIEDCSILAKSLYGNYAEFRYNNKEELILKLIEECENNNINYGMVESDIPTINSIILFDFPFGQVSWHTTLDKKSFKMYSDSWDGQLCSTLSKLEKFIKKEFIREISS